MTLLLLLLMMMVVTVVVVVMTENVNFGVLLLVETRGTRCCEWLDG